jgi:hypothetical protein
VQAELRHDALHAAIRLGVRNGLDELELVGDTDQQRRARRGRGERPIVAALATPEAIACAIERDARDEHEIPFAG